MTEEEKTKLARAITEQLPAPEEIRDDWGRFIIETVLPEGVWSRPGLATRERSLITIAALCALHRPNELKLHIGRGLDNGLSRAEVLDVEGDAEAEHGEQDRRAQEGEGQPDHSLYPGSKRH